VAARSKVWICSRTFAGIVGSSRAGEMDVCSLEGCVLLRRGLCNRPILCPEGPTECELETSTMRRHSPTSAVEPLKNKQFQSYGRNES
jgi:hypothetical protein